MGNGPWFPKNLYTRVRVLLGLPPGRDPFDQHARLGLRPSFSMGYRKRERMDAQFFVQANLDFTGALAAVTCPA
jgi:hypothetical protein